MGQFTVCESEHNNGTVKVGYDLPAENLGIPSTCAVSMARDMYPYWQTGLLDYTNTSAILGMKAAQNIATCMADYAGKTYFDSRLGHSNTIGNAKDKIDFSKLVGDNEKYKILGKFCSLPIIGTAEAVAKSYINQSKSNNYTQPWCTPWGAVAPRQFMSIYSNEYTFPNTAMKYQSLAQELHGIPVLSNEKWALAFPWESSYTNNNNKSEVIKGLSKKLKLPFVDDSSLFHRSEHLYSKGDLRLINTPFNANYIKNRSNVINRELKLISKNPYNLNINNVIELSKKTAGDRRIYTAFNHERCEIDAVKVKLKWAPLVTFWASRSNLGVGSCSSAFRYKFQEYVHKKILKRLCEIFDMQEGAPFKDLYFNPKDLKE